MKGLLARRELLKGMVEHGAMSRERADRIVRAEAEAAELPDETGTDPVVDGDETEIKLYDAVDSWGGFWGISAAEFADVLDRVETPRIRLRVNSPGGEVFEGVTIHNMVADHDAYVTVIVDSLAASIASVIAMAGDRIVMNRGAEMMIHNAWGLAIGDHNDMRAYAQMLERQTVKAARIYQARAGRGALAEWRDAMDAETWYDADEAVDAGLADGKAALKTGDDGDAANEMLWDLSIFNYRGRTQAPEPLIPTQAAEPAADPTSDGAPEPSEAPAATAARAGEERQRAEQVVRRARLALASADLA